MTLKTSEGFKAVRTRLTDRAYLPQTVHRNRGRLLTWQDVVNSEISEELRMSLNVLDGDSVRDEELIGSIEEVEMRARCLVEFLVYHPDDDERSDHFDAGLKAIVDALLPKPSASEPRDHQSFVDVGIDWIDIAEVKREGIAVDRTPQVTGAIVILELTLSAETVAG